jgi:hypothetical protein
MPVRQRFSDMTASVRSAIANLVSMSKLDSRHDHVASTDITDQIYIQSLFVVADVVFSYFTHGWKMYIVQRVILEHPGYLLLAYALFLLANIYRETRGIPRESFPSIDTVVRPLPPAVVQASPPALPSRDFGTGAQRLIGTSAAQRRGWRG